jgi:hypothetical protein
MSPKSKKAKPAVKRSAGSVTPPATVSAWQDDPASGLPLIARPVPDLSSGALKFKIKGHAFPPGVYKPDTPQFRYWTAAEALRRGGDLWAPLLGVKRWEPGPVLGVSLDKGVDLNAYYDRSELAFFHEMVGQKTYYSGESPDVVCHEMGHACLDAHRPELFDAPFVEVASFHESFGDMSAILCALQLPGVRAAALNGVKTNAASPLSRLAEQLGEAIRLVDQGAVDVDCLRNAHNAFRYVNPQTLPDSAPAADLCAEPHSFSRVFTGAFYEILSGMINVRSKSPTLADLAAVAGDFTELLVAATAAAPVQPNYYAQVASHIIDADAVRFSGKYRAPLTAIFVKRLILPKASVQPLASFKGKLPKAAIMGLTLAPRASAGVHKMVLDAKEFGLGDVKLTVLAPLEHKPFLSVAAGLSHKGVDLDMLERATHHFVKTLFARHRVDVETRVKKLSVTGETTREQFRKTHVVTKTPEGLKLTRRLFHCGCGPRAYPCGD